ncbi:hypothetical protein bsdtb5_24390 [Anaeromicropila herbilytica]|uniref:DUF1980 domain-containing protein n=1 Tax=Anaeromicropila herbilytica TaxID=2785025 RepID=A0A7R7IDJ3_9FIRM|nr:hypothetical protein bsdtb5_24390 [Anaeromicropila herbilytica]
MDSATAESNSVEEEEQSTEEQSALEGLDKNKKTIKVSDDNFYEWLDELYSNTSKYEGYQIQMKGFVYKDSTVMKKNEFALARMLMSCCVADLVPCGPLCTYDKAIDLKKDHWIIITGILHKGEYEGEVEPQIEIKSIKNAMKPKDEYIYPSGY